MGESERVGELDEWGSILHSGNLLAGTVVFLYLSEIFRNLWDAMALSLIAGSENVEGNPQGHQYDGILMRLYKEGGRIFGKFRYN